MQMSEQNGDKMKRQRVDSLSIVFICIIFAVCALFIGKTRATEVGTSLLAFYAVISVKWYNRRKIWFWAVIVVLVLAHLGVVIFLNSNIPEGPALAYIAPIAFVDAFAIYAVVTFIEKQLLRAK